MSKSMADRRSPLGLFPGQPMPRLYDRVVEVLRTTLQPPYRRGLPPLDSPLPPVSQRRPSVRGGKGQKDRVSMLPETLRPALHDHLRRVPQQHETDLKNGLGQAPLPEALVRKYPHPNREWGWQCVFPASSHYLDRRTGTRHRHHLHESVIQKAVHQAAHQAGLAKRVTTHAFHTGRPKTGREVI